MAKTFGKEQTIAGVLDAINMVSSEMQKPENEQDGKRAGQVALAAVKVAADSDLASDVGDMFDLTPITEIENKVEQAVEKIAAPPVEETETETDKKKDEIPF